MTLKMNQFTIIWCIIFTTTFIWSAINPADYFTWILEVVPAVIAVVVLAATYKNFPLTRLAYVLILIHCIVLMIGGHYTYAKVPAFDWIRDVFAMQRNNYDKIGHFAQGFIPAIVAREIIIRKNVVNGSWWTGFFSVCFCLAFSAFYELIEWWIALLSGSSAEAFLGTQGYVWDTQSDMALALIGSIVSIVLLHRLHDKQIDLLKNTPSGREQKKGFQKSS